jgi:glycosyltransferase XagB
MGVSRAHPVHETSPNRMHDGAADATERGYPRTGLRQVPNIPLSLVCLHRAGTPPDRLLAAARMGASLNVTPEQVMLCEGWIDERAYYRALARWLGLGFIDEPFELGKGAHYPQSIVAGIAQSADGDWVCAPEGRRIEMLARFGRRATPVRVRITTPSNMRHSVEQAFARDAAREASGELARKDAQACAASKPAFAQSATFIAIMVAVLACLTLTGPLHFVLSSLVSVLVGAAILLRLMACAASSRPLERPASLHDDDLPTYTIIVALHRESAIVRPLVGALDAIDYPRAKLDIKLVIEEDDVGTRRALEALDLPPRYHIIVAPDGAPRTKPRALNIALAQARGELVTVYDAEDEPKPDQLRKAAAVFAAAPANVGCLQGRLSIDNFRDGWIPTLFAIEYAALFEVMNRGLSTLDAPVALGGTSNHFRAAALRDVGGWDAWNVTEDIDLGFRLARHGYSVGALDSSTHEEAPARLRAWINQRRRWFKGWIQTLFTHTRSPRRLVQEAGPARAAGALLLVTGSLIGPMFGPAFALGLAMSIASGDMFAHESLAGLIASMLWCSVCAGGVASALWPAWVGLKRRGLLHLAIFLPLLPVYWALMSLAAWWALIDFIRNPFYWAKTDHGHAKTSWRRDPRSPELTHVSRLPSVRALLPGS